MKVKSNIQYIIYYVISFLLFAFSMFFANSNSILILIGIFGMFGMMYCTMKLLKM